jgi:hypothetical protein
VTKARAAPVGREGTIGAVEADHGAARQKAQENPQAAIVARNAGKLFLDGTVVAFRELTLSVRQQEIPRIAH